MTFARPFVKWAGGKTKLVPFIKELMPDRYNTYHEPFVGGGALFFALQPKSAVLSDTNKPLMNAYKCIRSDLRGVVERLKRLRYDEDVFYKVRENNFEKGCAAKRAAEFIYCNKAGFNGLYRVNSSGKFNVPFGRYTNPTIVDSDNLHAVSRALRHTTLVVSPFDAVLARANEGDFVYFDPPYAPLSKTSNFTAFSKDGFGDEDQRRLRDVASELKKRGVSVIVSNSAAPIIYELYDRRPFKIKEIKAARSINSDGEGRGKIKELLIY